MSSIYIYVCVYIYTYVDIGLRGCGNVALTLVKRPSLMCCRRRLFRTWPLFGVTLFNVFCFWGPKNTGANPDHSFLK